MQRLMIVTVLSASRVNGECIINNCCPEDMVSEGGFGDLDLFRNVVIYYD